MTRRGHQSARARCLGTAGALALGIAAAGPVPTAIAQDAAAEKPNILFIMGDDIGYMQPSIYHRGLMVGETPNIDRIGAEGALFTDYYAEQSCTAGRNAFFTGMHPLRTGMIPPQLPGSPSYLRPGTPALAKFLHDLGYSTGEFGKNHLGDHTDALPTAHGFQEFWGYLYHLDAMQGVSFPDINTSPTEQTVAPPCRNTPIPGLTEVAGAVDPATTICLMPPRPVLSCTSSDGTAANQTCTDEGPLTLERSKTVDEEISAKVIDFLDRNDPETTNKPFFVWYNPARMHITTVLSDEYNAMVGQPGGKDWGVNEAGMKQMDDNIGRVMAKLEEITAEALAFMDAAHGDGKPFFLWWNATRMHIFTHLKPESEGVTGLGVYADGMVEHDGMVGELLAKLDELGIAENTIVMYSTDNGAETFTWPDGGTTMFRGEKNTNWEGGYRVPTLIRWPGVIEPGTVINDVAAHEDMLTTLLAAAGEPDIKQELLTGKQIGDRTYKVHLDGYDLLPALRGEAHWPRREFLYWTDDGSVAALRYEAWKVTCLRQNALGLGVWQAPFEELRAPALANLRMDPFERAEQENAMGYQRWYLDRMFLIAPAAAFVGDWLQSFREFPPRQEPGSFNLERVMQAVTEVAPGGD